MLGGLSVSESAAEILLLGRNSLLPCGIPTFRRPFFVAYPRREKQRVVSARSALNDGGVAFGNEFEFTPSFSEYLKAMEFLKNEKYQTLKDSDGGKVSSNSPRGKKSVKRIENKSSDELTAAEENSRKGKKGAWRKEDSKGDGFRSSEMVERKQNRDRNLKMRNRKMSDGSGSETLSVERDAFKLLESGDDALGKPRVTRVDMEERIQKLAKW